MIGGWRYDSSIPRNLVVSLEEGIGRFRFVLRDRDTKFTAGFDAVSAAEGIEVLRTPVRAPRANAYAERWIGTVRREVLDRMLIFGCRQLQSVLAEYADHYNGHRPHRALCLESRIWQGRLVSQADLYPGVPSCLLLWARYWSCPSCTPATQSQPSLADGPIRGSLTT